jgi:hypothetical protein
MGSLLLRLTVLVLDLITIFGALVMVRAWHLGMEIPLVLWVLEGILIILAIESHTIRRQSVVPIATEPQVRAIEDV